MCIWRILAGKRVARDCFVTGECYLLEEKNVQPGDSKCLDRSSGYRV